MKRYQTVLALILLGLLTSIYSLVAEVNTAHAATRTTANSNLTSAPNVRTFIRSVRPNYLSYYKSNNLLYHPNAGAGWAIRTPDTSGLASNSGLLTRSNDGSNDQRNQCVDIDNSGFRFDIDIWANRGDGCGSNGTTTSYYVGGRVVFDPPNDVPVFLWVRDVDGLAGRQHIVFSQSAVQDIYIPSTNRSFDVEDGNDLISNGGFCSTESDGKCNAIVLLRASSFAIRAGMRDGNARISVQNQALAQYRTLTLNPNDGTVVESATPPATVLWSHSSGANLLREYEYNTSTGALPTPQRADHTFLGWYDALSGGNRVTARTMSSDITLYARWQENTPPPDNELRPYVSVPDTVTQGETVRFTYTINATGDPITTNWRGRVIIIQSGTPFPADFSSMHLSWTCANYIRTGITCSDSATVTGTQSFASSATVTVANEDVLITQPVGTRICRVLTVNPYRTSTGETRDSSVECTVVAKHPALQVLNGDVRVGGNFSSGAACTLPVVDSINSGIVGNDDSILSILMHNYGADSGLRGSFGSYAATAPGVIKRYGSAGFTYSNVSGLGVQGKLLLFGAEGTRASYASGANGFFHVSSDSDYLGSDTQTYCLPELANSYTRPAASTLANPLTVASTASGSRRYVFNGTNQTLSIPLTNLSSGQRTFIWVENNPLNTNATNLVRITGNILPPAGAINSVGNIPQFVLIVNDDIDLRIDEGVTSIYGVYSTKGNIYTCGDFSGRVDMSEANCAAPLSVNGALITNQRVLPYRTAGYSSLSDGTYAETFNLHPGVLVSDYVRARTNGSSFVTDYQQELPTRL